MTSELQWMAGALLLGCMASFSWAMSKFFVKPDGLTPGMKTIRACGIAFGILHLAAIVVTPEVSRARGVSGAVLYLCSAGLFWWAIHSSLRAPLSAAFSGDLPVHLVTRGPYKTIRHPLYSSYLLCWAAGWVITGRWWLAPTVAVMLIVYLVAAVGEEKKFARSDLSESYRRYRSRTGLFFPNPLKLWSGGGKRSVPAVPARDREKSYIEEW